MKKLLLIILFLIGLGFGHPNGYHGPITPYISPGIQMGYNEDKTFFLSYQLTLGLGFKLGTHFEDTFPLFVGKTFGVRTYFPENKPANTYKYSDMQLATFFGGVGIGNITDSNGDSFKKHKYWLGGGVILAYEKIFKKNKTETQFGIIGVLPFPLEMFVVSPTSSSEDNTEK